MVTVSAASKGQGPAISGSPVLEITGELAARLRAARAYADMERTQLARELDIEPAQLARYEQGHGLSKLTLVERWALLTKVGTATDAPAGLCDP